MLNTDQKILIARSLSGVIVNLRKLLGRPPSTLVSRGGFNWNLDLTEGIDLSIYLLGGFEVRTLRLYAELIKPGDTVLDIGANIGAHTLPFANLVGDKGKVIAFEPTKYAFDKLVGNLKLNPNLSKRVRANQIMLDHQNASGLPDAIYSSWPLESSPDLHQMHRGRLKSTEGAKVNALDDFVQENAIAGIQFMKLDVDGNEYNVLAGATRTLAAFQPIILMEMAPYVYESTPEKFDAIIGILGEAGYRLSDASNRRELPMDANRIRKFIPSRGGINALAMPAEIKGVRG